MAAGFLSLYPVWPACAVGSSLLMAGLVARSRWQGLRALRRAAVLDRSNAQLRAELEAARSAVVERERAEAASEAKSRFLATVSHEIRTPLGGILGLADLLADTALTREQQSYVAAVHSSGSALMTLIDEILDYARVEAGRLDLAAEPFAVSDLVEGVVELLAPHAQGKGLEIASRIAGDVPDRLIGDAQRLRQVLLNLAGNAVKFTEDGGVGVEVTRRADGQVVFSVGDTGAGVPQDRREAIFEPFEQAEGTASRRQGGTGLGLTIANTLVGAMGSEVRLTDRKGGGSLFSFAVVLSAATERPRRPLQVETGRCALIVSSGEFQPAFLASALEERGVTVLRARSRPEADGLLQRFGNRFSDVFVDCGQGEDDVRALAAAAAEKGVARRVLLFSPFERRAFGQTLAADYDAWLVKPIRDGSLNQRLADLRPQAPVAPISQPTRPPVGRSFRVLLAEDNPVNALVGRATLERWGVEVVHAENGHVALRAAEESLNDPSRRFDLILMDVGMPILDGLEVTRRIRAAEVRLGASPINIVATTADIFGQTRRDCALAGMDAVLIKPLQIGDLRRLVEAPDQALVPA